MPKGLWSSDPQTLLSQIVYHFANLPTKKSSKKISRCLFLPPLHFLYVGYMQAIWFSMMLETAKDIVFIFQWDHEWSVYVPTHSYTEALLWKKFSINKTSYDTMEKFGIDLEYVDEEFYDFQSLWYQLLFVRIISSVDTIAPIVLPRDFDKELFSSVLTKMYDNDSNQVFIYVWSLSTTSSSTLTRKADEKILTSSLLGKPITWFKDAWLLQLYCNVSQKIWLNPNHVLYEDSRSVWFDVGDVTGYVVSGY